MQNLAFALAFVVSLSASQVYVGRSTLVPTATPVCIQLNTNNRYSVQANLSPQSASVGVYLTSSVNVWNTNQYVVANDGPMPTDGGYVGDGGTYFQIKPPVVLKDTDIYGFKALSSNNFLCYQSGTTSDGGVSTMNLILNDVVQ